MTQLELASAALMTNSSPMQATGSQLHAIANAALRHAIDAGQVITKEAYLEQDRHWGKAERLLETMGYRCTDGEWNHVKDLHLYESGDVTVIGDKSSINVVQDLAERGLARDMAIAEAVSKETFNAIYSNGTHRVAFCDLPVDLAAIIAGVKA